MVGQRRHVMSTGMEREATARHDTGRSTLVPQSPSVSQLVGPERPLKNGSLLERVSAPHAATVERGVPKKSVSTCLERFIARAVSVTSERVTFYTAVVHEV